MYESSVSVIGCTIRHISATAGKMVCTSPSQIVYCSWGAWCSILTTRWQRSHASDPDLQIRISRFHSLGSTRMILCVDFHEHDSMRMISWVWLYENDCMVEITTSDCMITIPFSRESVPFRKLTISKVACLRATFIKVHSLPIKLYLDSFDLSTSHTSLSAHHSIKFAYLQEFLFRGGEDVWSECSACGAGGNDSSQLVRIFRSDWLRHPRHHLPC